MNGLPLFLMLSAFGTRSGMLGAFAYRREARVSVKALNRCSGVSNCSGHLVLVATDVGKRGIPGFVHEGWWGSHLFR